MKMSRDLSITLSDGTWQVVYKWIFKLRRTGSGGQFR